MARTLDDRLFARWCQRGDVDGLAELFDRVAPKLMRVALHVAADPAEAEDLIQETFVAAIEQRETLSTREATVGWMVTVLRHKATARQRRRGRAAHPKSTDMDALHAAGPDVDEPLARREMSSALTAAVDGLDEPYRQVMLLRLRHGASAVEIGHLLDRSRARCACRCTAGSISCDARLADPLRAPRSGQRP